MITTLVSRNLACLTPREVVKVPECISREDKVPDGERKEVDEHPADIGHLARGDNDQQTRKTENDGKKNERNPGCRCTVNGTDDEKIDGERDGSGKDQGTGQLHEDDELH